MIDFIGKRWIFALISGAALIPCLVALALWQLRPGIDFEGGLEMEVRFLTAVTPETVQAAIDPALFPDATVETTDQGTLRVRVPVPPAGDSQQIADAVGLAIDSQVAPFIREDFFVRADLVQSDIWFPARVSAQAVRDSLAAIGESSARVQGTQESSYKIRAQDPDDGNVAALQTRIEDTLRAGFGGIFVLRSDSVSGVLGAEIARDAAIAVAIASLAIMLYIWWSFRRLPKPWLYGTAVLIALMHDVIIVVGVFAILGEVAGMEVNAMFVTALLAVIGYSVNDTIVVFDRLRENIIRLGPENLRRTLNLAITETLGRSLNTSIAIVIALLALVMIGGVIIRPFALVLLIGAISGTYSSIAIASQVVVLWEEGAIQRWVTFGRRGESGARVRA